MGAYQENEVEIKMKNGDSYLKCKGLKWLETLINTESLLLECNRLMVAVPK